MPITPHEGETQSHFMDRCVPEMIDAGHPKDQAVAACAQMWRDRPNKGAAAMNKIHWKTSVTEKKAGELDFVLSDESPDRMGDVIRADGWMLSNFRKNPIALFGHSSGFPIGNWKNVRIDPKSKALVGTYERAPQGTGQRVDEINNLVDAGVLVATSVGFRDMESTPRKDNEGHVVGLTFTRQELVEASIVAVPANPNAVAISKELGVSEGTQRMVFDGLMDEEIKRLHTEHARVVKAMSDEYDALVAKIAKMAPKRDWSAGEYDLAVRHLQLMAQQYPANELWRKWRDEMQCDQLSYSRR